MFVVPFLREARLPRFHDAQAQFNMLLLGRVWSSVCWFSYFFKIFCNSFSFFLLMFSSCSCDAAAVSAAAAALVYNGCWCCKFIRSVLLW